MQDQEIIHDREVIRDFLVESYENLSRLDQELVELEKHPRDGALLASIFRTIHTIKGTCGFLAFSTLERITHQAENLLSQLRDRQRELNPFLISLILAAVDATRKLLASIEDSGEEGSDCFEELTERLRAAGQSTPANANQVNSLNLAGPMSNLAATPAAGDATPQRGRSDQPEHRDVEETANSSVVADPNIRVGVALLDKLMDLVGELVLTRNQILQFNTEREDAALNATAQRLNLITTELQEGVMKTRMQPICTVWNKLPRVVRDSAVSLNKKIELTMDGAGTELDRTIIEAIKDPLMHLVRNSCDHGIEIPEVRTHAGKSPQGRLTLRACHEGGQVNIEISDDGAGIDVAWIRQKAIEKGLLRREHAEKLSDQEALYLIFQPGFSTAKTLTNASGRGVGLDVVKSNIEKIGGVVDAVSRVGEGFTVKLKIPLTLAIIPGLVITSGGEKFVIPQVSLLELIRLEGDSPEKRIEHVHGIPVYRRRGSLLPVAYLNQVLGLKPAGASEAVSMVVLQAEDRQFGLIVDGVNDTQEIVVKPLGKLLKGLTVYAGATIIADGGVALILDVLGIGQRSGALSESREQRHTAMAVKVHEATAQQRLLLFSAGRFERLAIPLSLVARLEEFPLSMIEHAGGCQVVQYRNRILPLVCLLTVLDPGGPGPGQAADPAQVIVFNDGDLNVGLVVDRILDIAEEAVTVRQKTSHKGLLGSGIVGQRVADFVDLNYVLRIAAAHWFQSTTQPLTAKTILVAEGSTFSRGLMRSGLDMEGYRVVEAGNLEEAIRRLEAQPIDIIVAALDLPPNGSAALTAAIRQRPDWKAIPMLELAASAEQIQAGVGQLIDLKNCEVKSDQEAILQSLARLASGLAPAIGQPVSVAVGGR